MASTQSSPHGSDVLWNVWGTVVGMPEVGLECLELQLGHGCPGLGLLLKLGGGLRDKQQITVEGRSYGQHVWRPNVPNVPSVSRWYSLENSCHVTSLSGSNM